MFFDKLKQPNHWQNISLDSNKDLYNLFKNGFYNIYSYYDKELDNLHFIASLKKENMNLKPNSPLVISFCVDKKLNINWDAQHFTKDSNEQYVLYHYLLNQEKNSTDEKRNIFYSTLPDDFKVVTKYTNNMYKERALVRDIFKHFMENLEDFKAPQIHQDYLARDLKIHVNLHWLESYIKKGYPAVTELSLAIETKGKKYQIKDAQQFFNAYIQEEVYSFSKTTNCLLKKGCFDEKSMQILDFLLRNHIRLNYYDFGSKQILLYKGDFIKLLEMLEGSTIYLKEAKKFIKILPPIEGKVFFSTNNISIEPDIRVQVKEGEDLFDVYDLFFTHKNYFVYIDIYEDSINIISCRNNNACLLYSFIATLQYPLNVEYIDDLLSQYIGDNLMLVGDFEKDEGFNFKIIYQVSLTIKNKHVHFNTIYKLNDEEINDLTKINDNPLFRSKLKYFNSLLDELSLPLEGTGNIKELFIVKTADFSKFKGIADIWIDENILKMKIDTNPIFQVKAKYNIDWLDIKITSDTYSSEEIEQILSAYRKKHKFVLANDKLVMLDDSSSSVAEIAEIENELSLNKDHAGVVPVYNIFKLAALEQKEEGNASITFDVDENVKKILDEIKNYKKSTICEELENFDMLREYQKDGVKWLHTLYKLGFSGILADDMGLGKTLQTIAFMTLIYGKKPILIITPKSLVYNWEAEILKWTPKMKYQIVQGSKLNRMKYISVMEGFKKVYITSYDSLRIDIDLYKSNKFGLIVLDEGQYIKNDSALKTKAVKQLRTDGKLILTGTPIENSLDNLWSLFDFLMPNYFGSKPHFLSKYESAFTQPDLSHQSIRNELLTKVTPFILRRTKEEVLPELPPKTEKIIKIEMSELQHKYYESYRQNVVQEIAVEPNKKVMKILSSLTNLRMIAVDPSSFFDNFNEVSNKLTHAVDLIITSVTANHKVVIFSFFVKVLDKLRILLDKEKIKSLTIKGDVEAKDRLDITETFNTNKDVNVLLVSLKAGGVGLNFTGADTVIHLDPWWNIAVENQATDRTHRIGQTRPVTIYKLVSYNTIEDKIIYLQERKKELYDAVIRSGDDFISKMDEDDYKYLLS